MADGEQNIAEQEIAKIPEQEIVETKMKILKGLEALKLNELLSDFVYHVDGGKFPVHKIMLAARSPVFLKMFSTDHINSKEGVMHDISKEAFRDFLNFTYTGEIKNMDSHAFELLMISDKYKIEDLKSSCVRHLLSCLNEENAVEVFQAAHKYHCNRDLKTKAFAHIKRYLSKWNYDLPEEFLDAPKSVVTLMMMIINFEKGLSIEVAEAEAKAITKSGVDDDDDLFNLFYFLAYL